VSDHAIQLTEGKPRDSLVRLCVVWLQRMIKSICPCGYATAGDGGDLERGDVISH
jgi:hypothetical protein